MQTNKGILLFSKRSGKSRRKYEQYSGGTEMETVLDMMTEVGREVEGRESKTNKISRLEER